MAERGSKGKQGKEVNAGRGERGHAKLTVREIFAQIAANEGLELHEVLERMRAQRPTDLDVLFATGFAGENYERRVRECRDWDEETQNGVIVLGLTNRRQYYRSEVSRFEELIDLRAREAGSEKHVEFLQSERHRCQQEVFSANERINIVGPEPLPQQALKELIKTEIEKVSLAPAEAEIAVS